jgi:hypothetical protein
VISTSNILEQAFLAGRTGVQALREKWVQERDRR